MEPLIVMLSLAVAAALAGVWVGVAALRRAVDSKMGSAGAELRRLADANVWRDQGADQVRREISAFRESLDQMRAREQERRAWEQQTWQTLHRVAAVLAGGQRTGRVGENVLRASLGALPPSMVVTDFRVNGRVVEFGLVLPDGRRLPVDSKWTADRELQALAQATDPADRERLIRSVERAVTERAREVAGYLDSGMTSPVAVAAVPDAAYGVLRRAHADAYRQGVIVIPYSMALPVLLFLHSIVSRYGSAGDVEACLSDLAATLDAMEGTLENKVARASTMLQNGAEEFRGQVGKARATLARARDAGEVTPRPAEDRPRVVGVIP